MSYCPVYSCNSDAKKNRNRIHFFAFPKGNSVAQQTKAFIPLSNSRICVLHFSEDAYEPGHSPQFLEHIGFKETFRVRLKSDALPTLNKSLADASTSKARILTEKKTTRKGNSID